MILDFWLGNYKKYSKLLITIISRHYGATHLSFVPLFTSSLSLIIHQIIVHYLTSFQSHLFHWTVPYLTKIMKVLCWWNFASLRKGNDWLKKCKKKMSSEVSLLQVQDHTCLRFHLLPRVDPTAMQLESPDCMTAAKSLSVVLGGHWPYLQYRFSKKIGEQKPRPPIWGN